MAWRSVSRVRPMAPSLGTILSNRRSRIRTLGAPCREKGKKGFPKGKKPQVSFPLGLRPPPPPAPASVGAASLFGSGYAGLGSVRTRFGQKRPQRPRSPTALLKRLRAVGIAPNTLLQWQQDPGVREGLPPCPAAPASIRASSEIHSGDVNHDSGPSRFAFHIPPESVLTISRNAYHMPRNTQPAA